jgi:hypothetical protein
MILTVVLVIAVIGCAIGFYFYKKNNKPHVDPTPEPKPEPTPDPEPEPVVDSVKWKNTKTVHIPKEGRVLSDVELDIIGNPFIKFEAKVNGVIDNSIKFTPSEGNGFTKTTISVDENTSDESRIIEITVKKDGE